MALIPWGIRRKSLYTVVGFILVAVLALSAWKVIFTRTPTCTDGIQNADERGIDCGGACSLVCKNEARAPVVLWARAFQNGPKNFTAAAYVQNTNVGAGARAMRYTFQLLDDKGGLIVERVGSIDLPPVVTIPIIETNIDVGNAKVARALFTFSEAPVWRRISADTFPEVRVSAQELASDGSRLSAKVINDSTESVGRLVVTAVLFDATDTARAASQSIVDSIARKSSQDIVFTWPGGVPDIVRAEITVLPPF